jgi:hypothetical protein
MQAAQATQAQPQTNKQTNHPPNQPTHDQTNEQTPNGPVLVDDEDGEELGAVVLRRPAVPQELHLLSRL